MSNAVNVVTRGVYALAGVLSLLLGIVPLVRAPL